MADAGYVTIAPHNPNGPVSTAARIHFAAATCNFLILEEGNTQTQQYGALFCGGWKADLASWEVKRPG